MYKYTLGFIIRNNEVLLLNRNKSPWMGAWNGVGGKIEPKETIINSMIREIKEETGFDVLESQVIYKGDVTWNLFHANGQGLYLFIINLDDNQELETPVVVDEGILDWKPISWACDFNNQGIARNIPYFLDHALKHDKTYQYHCIFEGDFLKDVIIKEL